MSTSPRRSSDSAGAQQTVRRPASPDADLLPVGVIVAEPDGTATYANRAWRDLTGQRATEWRARGWLDVVPVDRREVVRRALLDTVAAGRTHDADWPVTDAAGRGHRVLHVTAAPDVADGHVRGLVATVTDVTDERALAEQLRSQATHDPLTGLCNRAQFIEFVNHALERRRRDPQRLAAVLFIDVDGLKRTNDNHGHDAGDQLLQAVATRITSAVRPTDIVARYGGDEFVVLCEDLRTPDEAFAIADRIRGATQRSNNGDRPCRVSIGLALAGGQADAADLVNDADQAMYRTKRSDRGGALERDPLDVIAAAAHEIRTPLTTISGFATTLRHERDRMATADVDAAFAALESGANRLARLLNDLLDLGSWHQSTGPELAPVALGSAVAEALQVAPPPAGVEVRRASRAGSLLVLGEQAGLARVVVNLLTNAYRYGGTSIVIDALERAGSVELGVTDDGPGVERELLETLFSPFTHGVNGAKAQPGGTGLGLALAREIVESFGGRLQHEAVRPHGARFTVTLPRAPAQSEGTLPINPAG